MFYLKAFLRNRSLNTAILRYFTIKKKRKGNPYQTANRLSKTKKWCVGINHSDHGDTCHTCVK